MIEREAKEIVEMAFDAWENEYSTRDDWSKERRARDMAIKALDRQSIDSIKVKKALERIKSLGLKKEIRTTDDVLDEMKDYTLFELADTFCEVSNLFCELLDLLESDEVTE